MSTEIKDVETLDKSKMLRMYIMSVTSPFLDSIIEDILPTAYFNGTEEELDDAVSNKRMVTIYSDEDIEAGSKSRWKINAGCITSYVIDETIEDEDKAPVEFKSKSDGDNVIRLDFNKNKAKN